MLRERCCCCGSMSAQQEDVNWQAKEGRSNVRGGSSVVWRCKRLARLQEAAMTAHSLGGTRAMRGRCLGTALSLIAGDCSKLLGTPGITPVWWHHVGSQAHDKRSKNTRKSEERGHLREPEVMFSTFIPTAVLSAVIIALLLLVQP